MKANLKLILSLTIVGLFSVTLLTMSNNYYFYKSRDFSIKSELDRSGKLIGAFYENCLINASREVCLERLKMTIGKGWGKGRILITGANNNVVLDMDKESYRDDRYETVSNYQVGTGEDAILIQLSKLSSPPLYLSTWRSMTFSYNDFLNNKSSVYFYNYLPRSYNPLAFALLISLLFFTYYKMSQKQKSLIQILEASNFRDLNILKTNREIIAKMMREKNDLKVDLSSKDDMLDDIVSEYDDLEKMNRSNEEQIKALLSDKQKISNLKNKKNQDTESLSYKISSDDKKEEFISSEDEISYAANDHHGKEFVESIYKTLKNDSVANRLLHTIKSSDIRPKKKGTVELKKISSKYPTQPRDGFILDIYSERDGFCAELVLAPQSEWQALLAANYIVGTKGFLGKKYDLVIKV